MAVNRRIQIELPDEVYGNLRFLGVIHKLHSTGAVLSRAIGFLMWATKAQLKGAKIQAVYQNHVEEVEDLVSWSE